VLIQETLEFDADPAVVWERLSDVERIPEFWHGTKSLRVLETVDGVKRIAAVKFAFGGLGKAEIKADVAARTLQLRYLSGPFTGTQTVRIVGKNLEARWDIVPRHLPDSVRTDGGTFQERDGPRAREARGEERSRPG
jgi:hypothetical protein